VTQLGQVTHMSLNIKRNSHKRHSARSCNGCSFRCRIKSSW